MRQEGHLIERSLDHVGTIEQEDPGIAWCLDKLFYGG
jgi:hypothetical protein